MPQRAVPYQLAVPVLGAGTVSPSARPGTSRRASLGTLVVVVVLIGGFVLFQVFSGGGTTSEWYQQGYDEGKTSALTFVGMGSTPKGACDLALMDKIKYDDSPFSRRVKDLRRGCLQAVEDLDDGDRLPTLP